METSISQTVGGNIKVMLAERDMSLRELARRTNVAPSMLCGIVSGDKTPSLPALVRIADALGTTPVRLMQVRTGAGEENDA